MDILVDSIWMKCKNIENWEAGEIEEEKGKYEKF